MEHIKTLQNILQTKVLNKKEVKEITERDLSQYMDSTILVETSIKNYIGKLGKFKNNFVLFEGDIVKIKLDLPNIEKICGFNKTKNIMETIVKCDGDEYCVHSKKGKNLGGPYKTMKQAKKRLKQVEYFKHMGENVDPLLKDRLKDRFFKKINEEIVNKDHKGRMTKSMQSSRDSIQKKLKNVKVIKGPPGRSDTPEEARFRLATYIEWKKKKSKGN